MSTSITTFKKQKEGDLQFPYVSKFGVFQSRVMGEYADRMADEGHNWQQSDLDAFQSFVEAGENDGWLSHYLFIAPLWGDQDAPGCLRVPLICKGTDKGDKIVFAGSGEDTTEVNSTTYERLALISSGKIIGAKQPESQPRCLATPHSMYDIQTKTGFANGGRALFGVDFVQSPLGLDFENGVRFGGCSESNLYSEGSGLNRIAAFTEGTDRISHLLVNQDGRNFYGANDYYFSTNINENSVVSRNGVFGTIIENVSSPEAIPVINNGTVVGTEDGDALPLYFLGFKNLPTDSVLLNTNPNVSFRWFSISDGSLSDDNLFDKYQTALQQLFASIGKSF